MRLRLDGRPMPANTICRGLLRGSMRLFRLGAVCILLLVISNMGDVVVYADGGAALPEQPTESLAEPASEEASATADQSSVAAEDGVDEPTVGEANDSASIDGNSEENIVVHAAAVEAAPDALVVDSSRASESDAERARSESSGKAVIAVDVKAEAMALPAWRLLEPSYAAETPLPASGKAMYYNPGVMDRVVESRIKYDHIDPCEECIGRVAMLRFGDVNRKVWLQIYGSHLEGPYHVIDAAATQHVGMLIERNWILDVDYQTAQRWGMRMPYVTIWEHPPLDILLANFALPLQLDCDHESIDIFFIVAS